MGRQFRRDDLTGIGIGTEMQFPPCASSPRTMLLDSHSPGPLSRRPVLSTSRCTGAVSDCSRGNARSSARRLNVEWSGVARSRPSSAMMDPINPSVCRNAKRNTARSVSAVVIANAE
jgi:hypothetical protein